MSLHPEVSCSVCEVRPLTRSGRLMCLFTMPLTTKRRICLKFNGFLYPEALLLFIMQTGAIGVNCPLGMAGERQCLANCSRAWRPNAGLLWSVTWTHGSGWSLRPQWVRRRHNCSEATSVEAATHGVMRLAE